MRTRVVLLGTVLAVGLVNAPAAASGHGGQLVGAGCEGQAGFTQRPNPCERRRADRARAAQNDA